MNVRALIGAITIALLIALLADRPPPSRLVQTDYCVIHYLAGAKSKNGDTMTFWAEGYGPCSQQDVYRQI